MLKTATADAIWAKTWVRSAIFLGDGLSAIGGDLGSFAKWAAPVLLTTARVFIDKEIDTWAKVVKENGIKAD